MAAGFTTDFNVSVSLNVTGLEASVDIFKPANEITSAVFRPVQVQSYD